jgi:tryptophan synthase beta chain
MVARFQSVISDEMKKQLQEAIGNPFPDYVFACVGGGSNAAGAFYHFLQDEHVTLVGVEAAGKGINSGESAATTVLGKVGRRWPGSRAAFYICWIRLSGYRADACSLV